MWSGTRALTPNCTASLAKREAQFEQKQGAYCVTHSHSEHTHSIGLSCSQRADALACMLLCFL
jgi:hypothetical protein